MRRTMHKEELMRKRWEEEQTLLREKAHKSAVRRTLERSKALLAKHKQQALVVLKYVTLMGGAIVFLLILIGAIILQQAESCRFPPNVFVEEFRYNINLSSTTATFSRARGGGGKLYNASGGKLEAIHLHQKYGTYAITIDPSPTVYDVVFKVTNRAKKEADLTSITNMTVEAVTVENDFGKVERRFIVSLSSHTSNRMNGADSCTRADVEVFLPLACLLDDAKLDAYVEMGDITTSNMTDMKMDTVTLGNEVGSILAKDLRATRVNLNTSGGAIEARGVAAHVLFMLARGEGDVRARSVRLLPGKNASSCRMVTRVVPGFSMHNETKLECEDELGTLTVDTQGIDGRAVTLEYVKGGNIASSARIGETSVLASACDDFSGTYRLDTAHGAAASVVEVPKPISPKSGAQAKAKVSTGNGSAVYHRNMPELPGTGLRGGVCIDNTTGLSPGQTNRSQVWTFKSLVTGSIKLLLEPPAITDLNTLF